MKLLYMAAFQVVNSLCLEKNSLVSNTCSVSFSGFDSIEDEDDGDTMWLVHTLEEMQISYSFDTTGPDFEFPDAITKIVVMTSPPWGVLPRTPHDKSLPVSDIETLARKFKLLYDKADKQYQSWKRSLLSEAAGFEKLSAYVRGLPVAISMNLLLHLPHHLAPLYQPQLVKEGFVVSFSFTCF